MGWKWQKVNAIEGENPWITYMKYRIHAKNNCINGAFVGTPGSGKSWAMLSMAHQIDPDFQLQDNLFFKAGEMMDAIRNFDHKVGKLWLYDEAGIDLNNLKYMDEINKGLNAFFQTARHRNYYFFCSVPYLNLISKGVRTLMNAYFKASGWTGKNRTIVFPRVMEYNGDNGKFYRKRLIVQSGPNGSYCNRILIPKPPVKLIREYEILKKEFTQDLFANVSDKIKAFEEKQKPKQAITKPMTETQSLILDLLMKGNSAKETSAKTNIDLQNVYKSMAGLRKRGYTFTPKRFPGSAIIQSYDVTEQQDTAEEGVV